MAAKLSVKTHGHGDFVDITDQVRDAVRESGVAEGVAVVFVNGSTAAIMTMEYEEGVQKDIRDVLEKIAPEDADWKHHKKWGDANGAAHIRSALIGTDRVVPIVQGKLTLGTWQQVVLVDFDEKPRERTVYVSVISS